MPQLLKRVCPRCNKGFHTYTAEMVYCNTECRDKHRYEQHFNIKRKLPKGNCLNCSIEISAGRQKFCNDECLKLYNKANAEQQKILDDMTKPVEKKKRKKGLSFTELNRRAEYRRLYDDFYINRQLTGKARDLI